MGMGLFNNSGKVIKANRYIVDYYGYIVTHEGFNWLYNNLQKISTGVELRNCKTRHTRSKMNIIGFPGFPGACVNHSKVPNVYFKYNPKN